MLSLRIGSRSTPVILRASVRWTQRGKISPPKVRAGIAVEFLPSEARGRDHLLSIAHRDDAAPSARRHQRIPIDLPIHWSVRSSLQERTAHLQNISVGGASIRATDWIRDGSDVFVTVVPPGAAVPMTMLGRVTWTAPGVGFGLCWRARDDGGIRRIKELVRRLEQLAETRKSHDAVAVATSFSETGVAVKRVVAM